MDAIFVEEETPRSRVAVLLKHFSQLADGWSGGGSPIRWGKCCSS
jgi:hypothetical protein